MPRDYEASPNLSLMSPARAGCSRCGRPFLTVGAAIVALLGAPTGAPAATPNPGPSGVGATSFLTLPFSNQIYQQSWGASPTLLPGNLFWESGSFFTDPSQTAMALQSANAIAQKGIVPFGGAQLWEQTYILSQPVTSFSSPPSWVNAQYANQREFAAWVQWVEARPQLEDLAYDGGTMPPYFRSFGGSWGHISPLTPLDAADWPAGISNATFGDWYAYKWGQTAAKSGAYGIALSDFSDSQPHFSTQWHDFNPRIVASFEAYLGRAVPGSTIQSAYAWIAANAFNQWTDFTAQGYANFYAALARQLAQNTGHESLVIDQNDFWPGVLRLRGIDPRILLATVPTANIVFEWNTHTLEAGRGGAPAIYAIGQAVLGAAREPNARIGANLSSNDPDFWGGVAQYWSDLSASDQQERGLKELKRLWLEAGWSEVADRSGSPRRALAYVQRDYFDTGTIDSSVSSAIQSIIPVKPFGPALYYSVSIERQVEKIIGAAGAQESAAYLNPNDLVALKNAGAAVGYYVSDAALSALQTGAQPSAWVVLDRASPSDGSDLLPATELQALQAIAPVVSSASALASLPNQPLSYVAGLTGIGFYDQNGRLVVTATNLGDASIDGTITLRTLADGAWSATDLFSGQVTDFSIAQGQGVLPVSLSRWDTTALAIAPMAAAPPASAPTPAPAPAPVSTSVPAPAPAPVWYNPGQWGNVYIYTYQP
jgi:hypothetical protein